MTDRVVALLSLSSHLAGLFLSTFSVPAEAHTGTRRVLAAALDFVMTGGLWGLGTIARPVATLLLVGKVQGIVQGASKEGISFMGLRRQEHRSRTRVSWLLSTRKAG